MSSDLKLARVVSRHGRVGQWRIYIVQEEEDVRADLRRANDAGRLPPDQTNHWQQTMNVTTFFGALIIVTNVKTTTGLRSWTINPRHAPRMDNGVLMDGYKVSDQVNKHGQKTDQIRGFIVSSTV